MNYLKENKELLIKYLFIIISNILIYILSNFYFKNFEYSSIIMFLIVIAFDMFIYYYKGTKKFKIYLDIISCFVIGLILLLFIDDPIYYSCILFNLFFANNIAFMQSRKSEKVFLRGLQYLLIIFITILCMILNLLILFIFMI